jgi:hypothetical protein
LVEAKDTTNEISSEVPEGSGSIGVKDQGVGEVE